VKKFFIHIPKNGGTSVTSYPNIFFFVHNRWKDINKQITDINTFFAVIRNPWARVVSRYVMGIPSYFRLPGDIMDKHRVSFNSFEGFLETRHIWVNEWVDPIRSWHTQYDYVCNEKDVVCCDILKLENIDKELAPYLGMCLKNVVKENVGEYTKDYKEYYNSKSIQIIADWYKKDIDYWGFDFDTRATKNTYFKFI